MPGAFLPWVLVLAACGGSAASTTAKVLAKVPLKSAAILGSSIPARYTCDGEDISPPVEWGAVPAGTHSLTLFVVGLTPEPSTASTKVSVEWALAGLNPALHRLAAGQIPAGAYSGVGSANKKRYSICPAKGSRVEYAFEVYGLPASQAIAPDFGALAVLQELTVTKSSSPVTAHGSFTASYTRR
jgi:phosphatidylethanolamine-binding protein (PEBP) family uncharacterized protein